MEGIGRGIKKEIQVYIWRRGGLGKKKQNNEGLF
jgi:hypothetical protein